MLCSVALPPSGLRLSQLLSRLHAPRTPQANLSCCLDFAFLVKRPRVQVPCIAETRGPSPHDHRHNHHSRPTTTRTTTTSTTPHHHHHHPRPNNNSSPDLTATLQAACQAPPLQRLLSACSRRPACHCLRHRLRHGRTSAKRKPLRASRAMAQSQLARGRRGLLPRKACPGAMGAEGPECLRTENTMGGGYQSEHRR